MAGGWMVEGPDVVLQDAQDRLASGKPWEEVKLSLMITVRYAHTLLSTALFIADVR